MTSYQEDQSVNCYDSGIADVNEDDEGEIDSTTEVRYLDVSLRSTLASNFTFCKKLAPVNMYSIHFRNQETQKIQG